MLATTLGFAQDLKPYNKDGKYGWKDENGKKVVIKAQYQETANFDGGTAKVKMNDKWGMIDKTGKVVIPIEYEFLNPEGNVIIMQKEKGGKMGFINKEGKEVLPLKYDVIKSSSYSEVYFIKLNGKWGLMSLDFKELNEIKYDKILGPIGVNPYVYKGTRNGQDFRLSAQGQEEAGIALDVTIRNDTAYEVQIHTGSVARGNAGNTVSEIKKVSAGSSISVPCEAGREISRYSNDKKGKLIVTISSNMCGKTLKLSEY